MVSLLTVIFEGTSHSVRIYLSLKASTLPVSEEKSKDILKGNGDYSFLPDMLWYLF
jgi:hypothetical protein